MPTFVNATTAHVSGGPLSITINRPTGSTGDTFLVVLYGNGLGTVTPPAGFSQTYDTGELSEGQVWVGRKERTGTEPSTYTFSLDDGSFVAGAILDYSGMTDWDIDAIDVHVTPSGTTVSAPDITVVGSTDLYVAVYATFDGRSVSADPPGLTLRASDISSGNQGLTVYDETLSSSGLITGQSQTISSSDSALSVAMAFVLVPPKWHRTRGWSATASTSYDIPTGVGYEINGRTRGWTAAASVSPPTDLTVPEYPAYQPLFTPPVTIDGQPYLNNVKTPWIPYAADYDIYGRLNVVIDGEHVSWFRRDGEGNKVWTHILRWTDKSPGGDDLLDLWFPAITSRDDLGSGDLSWLAPDRHVHLKHIHPDGVTIGTVWEGVVDAIEDNLVDQPGTGDPAFQLIVHCLGIWADLDRFITLPRPSIDQYIRPIPTGHLTPVDPGQLVYAHIHRAHLYGWAGWMRRPDDTGLEPNAEQGAYGVPLGSQTVQDILATMQTGSVRKTIKNIRPRGLKLDDLDWDGTSFDFSFHCMQPGVTHNLTRDPREAYNAIYGHGQAPFGPVDSAIGRPDSVADWSNWQYPIAAFDPPDYPLPVGQDFFAGDGHTGFQPFSDELRAHGYPLDSRNTYLSSDLSLIERFQDNSGAQVDGIVGPQTWAQAFQISVNSKALAQSYIKELVTSNTRMPFRLNARGGILKPNPDFDPINHPRREVMEEFGSLRKKIAVKSAEAEYDRIHAPIYRGTITATNVDPPEIFAFHTRAGMSMKFKGHAGADRILFVAQVERVPGSQPGENRTVTWTVSEQPEGLMTLAARLQRNRGIKDLIASNRPPRHHAKQIESYPIFDAESGAGIFLPGQGQTGGLWNKFLIPMGGQVDVNAVKIVASSDVKMAAAIFANPYMTIERLIALPGLADPSSGTVDPWAKNAAELEDLGICWSLGNPTAMGGYWPNQPDGDLTGVLYDSSPWPFRANTTYGSLFVWTNADCDVSGDPSAHYRVIFPNPVGQ